MLLVAGSLLSTLCYAFTIRADLGLGPLFTVQDGLAGRTGMSIGQAVMMVGVIVVVLSAGLRSWPGIGTLALPFLGGALDWMLPYVPEVHGTPLRVAVVAAATWLMALGGAVIMRAALGPAALDGVMLGLQRIVGLELAPTRLLMEAAMLAGGWVLGGAVGLGTVITGLLIGPGMQFWLRVLSDGAAANADDSADEVDEVELAVSAHDFA